ncbi:efflux RND transporter periplasmic adaptor subunit [Parafilimonas terrae]|uniref:Membrane fusion protein, multidrug efflux system n=1 Tax=Parafilimonas terrae TaxID=1465490 RepID=A0A1I5VUT9_9BACT|nr:efflux RND transporter periplasmic adaptor subunit [Parafilimonas terrae]SFQ11163.1 membrane fusion protein, multidrug efflux system [Parafilimonas terrae]
MIRLIKGIVQSQLFILIAGAIIIGITYSCNESAAENSTGAMPPPQLPVIDVKAAPATTYQLFPASIEGKVNVEIRPQVDGYLQKMYVDEGAYVKEGQPLFKINDAPYIEQLNNAKASLQSAEATLQRAKVELDRLTPLVDNNVISDVQLKTARANYDAAVAAISQNKAIVSAAQINVGYTLIKAPVSGYIGKIPYKTGALVGKTSAEPLTLLSDVSEVYAYFSLSEADFIAFKNQFEGNTIEEKLKHVPPVELQLANDSLYKLKGKIETVEGQFDETTGSISFRATFPNASGVLRSGNTGKIRIPKLYTSALVVPQEATYEIQDKVFVYVVSDSNKVTGTPINVSGKTANYYFVDSSLVSNSKIVLSGITNLRDGMLINPQPVSTDSLFKARPISNL